VLLHYAAHPSPSVKQHGLIWEAMGEQIPVDRASFGLCGSVRAFEEYTILPPASAAAESAGSNAAQPKTSCEFDSNGRLTVRTYRNPDGSEGGVRFLYNPSGLLLRTISGMRGQAPTESVNEYDDRGRIERTTSSAPSLHTATHSYDEHGRKKKIQTSGPEDYRPNLSFSGAFAAYDHAPNLPGGGTTTTFYDEEDKPYEIEVRDDLGELVERVTRTYGENGNVAEEAVILPDPIAILPRQTRERILDQAGASVNDLRDQLSKLIPSQPGLWSVKYERDVHGRVIKTRRRIFNREETIETSYNDHGGVSREITRGTANGDAPDRGPQFCEAIHAYQYDANGNWTEQIVSYRNDPGKPFKVSSRTTRTLTYY